jgi:hypothetical protein
LQVGETKRTRELVAGWIDGIRRKSRKLIASAKARPPLIIWNNEHFGLMPPTLSRDHCA